MGQITNPIAKGISVLPTDRESGPTAGPGASGNNVLLLGLNAGKNSTINNLVALGSGAAAAGITDVHLAGTVDVGVGNISALTTGDTNPNHPVTVLGSNNLSTLASAGNVVAIGSNIYSAYNVLLTDEVYIGNTIFPLATSLGNNSECVIIGSNIGTATTTAAIQSSILIGNSINPGVAGDTMTGCVVIGNSAASWTLLSTSVLIGGAIVISANQSGSSVLIGSGVSMTGNNASDDRNVGIGQGVTITGVQNTVVGQGASSPAQTGQTKGNTCIGCKAGTTLPGNASGFLVIEQAQATLGAAIPSALIYGDFTAANLILGASVQGTNRDLNGTNTVKLLNGTKGAAPVGGGYFYVTGGFLHWVDSAGTDSQLSETAAGQLASSALVAYTNNAAANAGTLTNAPAIGNPTKWIPINDNGTIRNIPAW